MAEINNGQFSVNIIWVTSQIPGRISGGQVRQFHLLKYLALRHSVVVISLVQPGEEVYVDNIGKSVDGLITAPFASPRLRRTHVSSLKAWSQLLLDPRPRYAYTYPLDNLRKRLKTVTEERHPDIVHLESLFTAPLSADLGDIPWVLGQQNVESLNAVRMAKNRTKFYRRLAGKLEAGKLARWEKKWVTRSDACTAVSEREASIFREYRLDNRVHVVPNGVEVDSFAQSDQQRRTGLLYFGTLSYRPNWRALDLLCREILPDIRREKPDVELTILGGNAPENVSSLGDLPGVNFTGFVEDVRPYLWKSAALLVPLRSGAGTRLKVLEAMAAGCPVISTALGVEGLKMTAGQDYLKAESAEEFVRQTLALLDDDKRATGIAHKAHEKVRQRYDWSQIGPRLEAAYESVLTRTSR